MARKLTCMILAMLVVSVTGSIFAGEVVRFVDGRYLEIKSHEIDRSMIRLNLRSDSYLIVPVNGVETIERGGLVVYHLVTPERERNDTTPAGKLQVTNMAGTRTAPAMNH